MRRHAIGEIEAVESDVRGFAKLSLASGRRNDGGIFVGRGAGADWNRDQCPTARSKDAVELSHRHSIDTLRVLLPPHLRMTRTAPLGPCEMAIIERVAAAK